jgi:uncharacterized damage-inducible protein DinB
MSELAQCLIGDSYATPAAHILEALTDPLVHAEIPNAPHTIYAEVWHLAFWQQITLDWIADIETPFPERPTEAFPTSTDDPWPALRQRFIDGARQAASVARDNASLGRSIRCPSRPGQPTRTMTVREQLESLAAHNAYHLGRIVLLRQLLQAWPPPSGGFTW